MLGSRSKAHSRILDHLDVIFRFIGLGRIKTSIEFLASLFLPWCSVDFTASVVRSPADIIAAGEFVERRAGHAGLTLPHRAELGGRPICCLHSLVRLLPSAVRMRIRSRSTSKARTAASAARCWCRYQPMTRRIVTVPQHPRYP